MSKIIFNGKRSRVIETSKNEYDVLTYGNRDYDGINETDWNFNMHFTNDYSRDWLGNTFSKWYNVNNEEDYAFKEAMRYAEAYEKR
jgi:hypothetical protein